MTILKDISSVLKDAKNIVKELNMTTKPDQTSLARMSSATTLQFPVIVSRSIDTDTAQSITKALERQYAIFVQMVISLNPYLDLQNDSMSAYLKRIHQNSPTPIDLLESCTNVYSDEVYGIYMMTSINNGSNGSIVKSNKDQMFTIEEHLNPTKINDLYKPNTVSLSVAESSLDYFCKKNNILLEADNENQMDDAERRYQEKRRDDFNKELRQYNVDERRHQEKRQDAISKELRQNAREDAIQRARFNQELQRAEAEYRSKAMVKLSDNDVKKANELVPTTLSVSMQIKDGNSFGGLTNFIIGIKGLMHPVNSNEIVSNLLDGYKSGNKFFNFIRWTTGEIAFLKDLVFNINEIKDDVAKKYSKTNSHWWTTLKRRKALAKARNMFSGGKKNILPNASIVCSMEEIAEIKDVYGVDLMDVKNIKKLIDRYFLLGFAIVDDSQELCYFIFDGENNYQAISYKGLEKENNSKNDFKDIYKMINSGRL